jgi:hypothetical protein
MGYFSNKIDLSIDVVQSNPYNVCFNSSTLLTCSNVVLYPILDSKINKLALLRHTYTFKPIESPLHLV